MGNIVKTAKCRFCGQMTQIEADEKLTAAQAEEQATMTCNCTEAVEYQKEKQRKEKAMASSGDTIRLQTERDTYKTMYEQLLNRLVNGGAA